MKLEFRLLIVDDAPDSIRESIDSLEEHLESKGFSLNRCIADNLSSKGLRDLAREEGKNYDLVIVDYNLGQADTDGAAAAARLRRELQYTDMVFYSSDPELNLHEKLAEKEVAGVFVARRDELSTALTGLANTVIGKTLDLNHMRGIAMAEVAGMDVLMEETLGRAFRSTDDQFVTTAAATIKKLQQHMQKDFKKLEQCLNEEGLPGVVSNSRLFSSTLKSRAITRVATKCLPEQLSEEREVLQSYEADIIRNRNMLAHAKEDTLANGEIILRSIKSNKVETFINDSWMENFRKMLKKHRTALTIVCKAISEQISAAEAVRDSEEC